MINSGFIFISYSFHAGQPLPCPQPLSIHLHPWARCSGRCLPGGAGREEMLIPQPEVWPAAQTVCSIFCCVSITQQYSTVIFNYFTLFEKIKQESEKWGTERWTCSLSRSHFFYRDHHRADHDDHQHTSSGDVAQNPLCQSHWHVPHGLLCLCVSGPSGVCLCQLHFLWKRPSKAEEACGKDRQGKEWPFKGWQQPGRPLGLGRPHSAFPRPADPAASRPLSRSDADLLIVAWKVASASHWVL